MHSYFFFQLLFLTNKRDISNVAASGTSERSSDTTTLITSEQSNPIGECAEETTAHRAKGISYLDDPFNESSSTAKTVYLIVDPIIRDVSDETLLPPTASNPPRSFASDVLEMARTRFDNFWKRNSKDETT